MSFLKIELKYISFIFKNFFPLVIFIMTKKTQLPFIAFTLFSAAPGNVSLKPVTSEGVLLSQGTDEAMEIQRGQALCQRTYGSKVLESGLEHRSFWTQSLCFLLIFHELTLFAVWHRRSHLIAWDHSSFICDMGIQNYTFSKRNLSSFKTPVQHSALAGPVEMLKNATDATFWLFLLDR